MPVFLSAGEKPQISGEQRAEGGYATSGFAWAKAGLGAAIAVGFTSWLAYATGMPLLMAPFGATSVILFALPQSPLGRPINVIGGYLLAAAISLALRELLLPAWWSVGLAVGATVLVTTAARVVHPPAGGVPILVLTADPGLEFLFTTVLGGSLALTTIAILFHSLPPRVSHPSPVSRKEEPPQGS